MVQLVGRSELGNAIALNSSLNNATRIVGPALAGVLIETTGLGMCFLLNAISFIPVIWAIAAMRPSEFHPQADTAAHRNPARIDPHRVALRSAHQDASRSCS